VPAQQRPRGARNTTRVTAPVTDLAALVDTRTWTTGGGNTFPGAIAPWGEVQWSPDTIPNRSAGGGYSYGDTKTTGYSLTHVSGPGCGAGGDIPMLPITGDLPSGNPNDVTTAFSNDNEVAQAGYYSAQSNQPNTITSQFTATSHSSMARFTYPSGQQAGFLIKLHDSQNGEYAPSTATVVSNTEISGSETSGHFCGEGTNDGQKQEYTAHFDITFDQPFTAQVINGSNGPDAVYLTFDTSQNQTVQAKLGLSYVSDANAKQDWQQENPDWNFDGIKSATQQQWNDLLGRMQYQMYTKAKGEFDKIAGENKAKSQKFMADNRLKTGIKALPSGVQYRVIEDGTGTAHPTANSEVTVHYRGSLMNGLEFDSSFARGEPVKFKVGDVIKGWQDVLTQMRVGDHWQIFVPPELAYGERGQPPRIGPNEALVFELKLVDIK